jgi:hypothetical protein
MWPVAKITPAVHVQIVPMVVIVLGRTRRATSQSATGAMTRMYPRWTALHSDCISLALK